MESRLCKAGQAQLIEGYQLLLEQFSAMRESAKANNWASLIEQECRYLVDTHTLRDLEQNLEGEMEPAAQLDKARLSRAILTQSVEVSRSLVERRDTLRRLIAAKQHEAARRRCGDGEP